MKNVGFTLLMMLFVGIGTSMAQDKKAADAKATTEVSTEKHDCKPGCSMTCCAKDGTAAKKSCTAEEKAKCAAQAAHTEEGKAEEHDHSSQPH
ncbi:MAG: hypothetical protein RL266_2064 [Bacteroidota bacterium]